MSSPINKEVYNSIKSDISNNQYEYSNLIISLKLLPEQKGGRRKRKKF